VLYYYTFEIRVVLLKVKSESHLQYHRSLNKAKGVLTLGLVALLCSYAMEIFEKIELYDDDKATTANEKALIITNRLLSLVTEMPLIYL
jgi:hypothetical protein